jgi:hypothetical protein
MQMHTRCTLDTENTLTDWDAGVFILMTEMSQVTEREKVMGLFAELQTTGVPLRIHRTVMKAYRNNAVFTDSTY